MDNKGKAVFYVIAGGYLLYLAYQLFTGRMDNGGKDGTLVLVFSILFAVAGVAILVYTAIAYKKMQDTQEEEAASKEDDRLDDK